MCLILQIIGILMFLNGHSIYGQEISSSEKTGSAPARLEQPLAEDQQQDMSHSNQAPPTPQSSDLHPDQISPTLESNVVNQSSQPSLPDNAQAEQPSAQEQKMYQEWLNAQQAAQHADSALAAQPAQSNTTQQGDTTPPASSQKSSTNTPPSSGSAQVQQSQPALPSMPQSQPKELKAKKPEVPVIEEIKGINTVDLEESRGNWLFKRIWWERAEQKYEKIRLLVEKIIDSRMQFFERRTQIDREVLDPFKHAMGMEQGELKTIVSQLIVQLQQEREKDGVLNAQERDLLQLLTNERKSIEQLQGYLETITKLDQELDEALNKLLEQINVIRRYERKAWQHFKDIARVLSDTKARELYHSMDVAWTNIQEIQEYLQEPFQEHFDHLINMIMTHVEFIKKSVEALKDKGIDLQARMKAQTAKKQPVVQDGDEQEEEEETPEQGFIGRTMSVIASGFKTMWDYTLAVITWPYTKLFGSTESDDEVSDEENQDEPSEQSQEVAA